MRVPHVAAAGMKLAVKGESKVAVQGCVLGVTLSQPVPQLPLPGRDTEPGGGPSCQDELPARRWALAARSGVGRLGSLWLQVLPEGAWMSQELRNP